MNYVLGCDVRLGSSQFRKDLIIALSLYGLKSFTAFEDESRSDGGRELAWGIEFTYPNDLVNMRMGHMQVQENFVAGTGFVPRPGVSESYGELLVGPRPGRWGILQVQGGTGLDHISGFSGRLLTREWNLTPLNLRFLSGEEIGYRIYDTYEYLTEPFPIYQDYIIPGSYDFLYTSFSTPQNGERSGALDYRSEVLQQEPEEVQLKAGCQVIVPLFLGGACQMKSPPVKADLSYHLPVEPGILFTPDITLYNFVQYDSQSGRLGLQSRFQWIIKPGREIFLVWNSIAQDPYERFQLEEASARLKVKFTLRF
jgi:hypothetical protein